MESPTEMIVDSTRRHLAKREQNHFQRVLPALGFWISRMDTSQEIERYRPRELWRHTETAFVCVVTPRDLLIGCIQGGSAKLR